MVKLFLIVLMALLPMVAASQEVLLPVGSTQPFKHSRNQAIKQSSTQAIPLPFFDDFAGYEGAPDSRLWDTGGAVVRSGFAPLPPTVGTLVLDAYDMRGQLYPQATASRFPADTVTSRPIRLDTLGVADSVVFSFYYLPGGGNGNMWERVGETPDAGDSLVLEFFADSVWHTVWARGGVSVDTLIAQTGRPWQYVAVVLSDSRYFDSSFRFRFRNYCSLEIDSKTGRTVGGDQWSIDYVLLDRGRTTAAQPDFRDVAFVDPAPSMLRHYQAMPARQFRASDMADHLNLTIGNLFSSPLASHYGYRIMSAAGDTLYSYDGGYENAPAGGYQTAPIHASPTVNYTFEQTDEPRVYTVVHNVREGTGGDPRPDNDTVRFVQRFENYYAYDDGVAENGYGITSTASRIYLAYRFDLNVDDTISAVDLFFNRTYHGENESVQFYITVWQADAQGRPGEVLYRDAARRTPVAGSWHRYALEHPTVVGGSIFVGFEQIGNTYVNIGFDRSFNSSDRIFYLTSTEWQQSILSGSLLLRPCFGSSALLSIPSSPLSALHSPLSIFPNPAVDYVTIEGLPEGSLCELYDTQGRKLQAFILHSTPYTLHFPLSTFHSPLSTLLLRAVTPQGSVEVAQIIIRHQP